MTPTPNYMYQMYGEHRKYESRPYFEAEFFWHFRIIRKAPRILIPALIYLIIDWLGILITLNNELPNIVSFPLIMILYSESGVWIQKFPLFFAYLIIKSIYDYILFPIWVTILVREALTQNQPPLPLLKSFTQTFRFIGSYLLQFVFIILAIAGYIVCLGLRGLGEFGLSMFTVLGVASIFLLFCVILFELLGVITFIVGVFRNTVSFKANFQDARFIIKQKGGKLVGLSIGRNWIMLIAFFVIALINWGVMLLYNNSITFTEAFGTFDLSFYIMVLIYVTYITLTSEIKNYLR